MGSCAGSVAEHAQINTVYVVENWAVIEVNTGAELRTASAMEWRWGGFNAATGTIVPWTKRHKRFEVFCPTYREERQRFDYDRRSVRREFIIKPLFPGYLFVDANHLEEAISPGIRAVRRAIEFGGKPGIVDADYMAVIKAVANSPKISVQTHKWADGDRVQILIGGHPVEGTLSTDPSGRHRFLVWFEMFRRGVSVPFDSENAVLVSN